MAISARRLAWAACTIYINVFFFPFFSEFNITFSETQWVRVAAEQTCPSSLIDMYFNDQNDGCLSVAAIPQWCLVLVARGGGGSIALSCTAHPAGTTHCSLSLWLGLACVLRAAATKSG